MDEIDPRFNTYLCAYCNNMYTARAGSVDRTRPSRCAVCAAADAGILGGAVCVHDHYVSDTEGTV